MGKCFIVLLLNIFCGRPCAHWFSEHFFLASLPLFPGDVSYGIVLFIIITEFQSLEISCSREMTSNDNIPCIVKSHRAEALQNLTRWLRFVINLLHLDFVVRKLQASN